MAKLTVQDIYKSESNDKARKPVNLKWFNGQTDEWDEMDVVISKVLIDKAEEYTDIKTEKGAVRYFSEVIMNHVFDPESGNQLFTRTEIIQNKHVSVDAFVNKHIPLGFIMAAQEAINEFSGVNKPRQQRIDEIKN